MHSPSLRKKSPQDRRESEPLQPTTPPPTSVVSLADQPLAARAPWPCGCRVTPKHFLACLCVFVFCQATIVIGLTGAVISTVEKRYGFNSTKSGVLFAVYDLAVLLIVTPLSYCGAKYHKPRVLGLGLFVFGLGSCLFALPHQLGGRYTPSAGFWGYCSPDNAEQCEDSDVAMYYVFLVAQVVIGIGAAPLYTLGPAYLDENLPKDVLSVYVGIFFCTAAVGPAAGFLIGAQTLNVYVHPTQHTDLSPSDPEWVGAWWLLFLGVGGLSVVASVWFFVFPKAFRDAPPVPGGVMRTTTRQPSDDGGASEELVLGEGLQLQPVQLSPHTVGDTPQEGEGGGGGEGDEGDEGSGDDNVADLVQAFQPQFADSPSPSVEIVRDPEGYLDGVQVATPRNNTLLAHVLAVVSHRVWLFNALGQSSEALVVSAFSAFLPKMLQSQFSLTSAMAATYTGIVIIPGAAGGTLLGGFASKWLRLSFLGTTRFCVTCALISAVLCFSFFMGCDEPVVVGINFPYGVPAGEPLANADTSLEDLCNEGCNCVGNEYKPVCGSDGLTYVNACFAGCTSQNSTSEFSQCACIGRVGEGPRVATLGPCKVSGKCESTLSGFLFLLFLVMFFTFLNNTPATVVQIRVLGEELSPVGLSLNSVCYRIFGSIPGPIVLGTLLDTACTLRKAGCGEDSCELYSPDKIRLMAMLLAVGAKASSCLMFGLSWRSAVASAKARPVNPAHVALEANL